MFIPAAQSAYRTLRKTQPRVRLNAIFKNGYSSKVSYLD